MKALQTRPAVALGCLALAYMLGLATGNGWTTHEAIDGSSKWWQQYCHQQVKGHVQLQEKLDNQ